MRCEPHKIVKMITKQTKSKKKHHLAILIVFSLTCDIIKPIHVDFPTSLRIPCVKICHYACRERLFSEIASVLKDPFPAATLFTIDFELGPALYSPWGRLTGAKKFWPKKKSKWHRQGKTFFRKLKIPRRRQYGKHM